MLVVELLAVPLISGLFAWLWEEFSNRRRVNGLRSPGARGNGGHKNG